MIESLLALIQKGGSFETHRLAAQLGITPEMVQALLEHLQRSGRIQPYQACGDGCGGCDLKSACRADSNASGVRLWRG